MWKSESNSREDFLKTFILKVLIEFTLSRMGLFYKYYNILFKMLLVTLSFGVGV